MSQPRYAPRRARPKLSLTRTVTSAAALAALALVCGPALERSADSSPAAAAVSAPEPVQASEPAPAEPVVWNGVLAIRPSRFAKAKPGSSDPAAVAVEATALGPAGPVGALGIPLMVLRAYHLSADQLGVEQPSCKLPWWLLAGIGHTESGHAESGRLTEDGTTRGRILGPQLSGGIPGDAIITDTDHGALDGDPVYDRAVGPMQFIPSTWLRWGADGNGDGKSDPSNIFDATLAAGRYLCAGGRDLSTQPGLEAAVLSYNHSAPYLATVLAWGQAYRDGASALPDSPLPVVSDVTKVRPPRSARPPKPTTNPSKLPGASASPSGSQPSESASASSSASATPTATASATGCPSVSPSPTESQSSSAAVDSATAQSRPDKSASGSATASSSVTASSSATASSDAATPSGSHSPSGSTSASRVQSATAQSATAQSATAQSATAGPATDSSSASSSSSTCAP